MTRWLPRSLFGRNVLLMAGLLALCQLCTLMGFWWLVQRPRVETFAQYAHLYANSVSVALQSVSATERAAYLAQVNTVPQVQVRVQVQPANVGQPSSGLARELMARMQRLPQSPYQVLWQEQPEKRLWLGTGSGAQTVWIGFLADGFLAGTLNTLLISVTAVGALALLGAGLIQRRINRPLTSLAAAAQQVAQGQFTAPPQTPMPTELAAVRDSFGLMAQSLAKADEHRTLMLAGISHDVRTPLAKVRLGLELLGPQRDARTVQQIENNIDAIDAIVGQFVDFARTSQTPSLDRVDLNLLCQNALALAGLEAAAQWHAQPLWVMADSQALQRAVQNLLRNAELYAPPGSVAMQTSVDNGLAALHVMDRGPGITPHQWQTLRQPFVRGNAARSNYSGAGLGLAIVQRIVQAHGGQLVLNTREGGGANIAIMLARVA